MQHLQDSLRRAVDGNPFHSSHPGSDAVAVYDALRDHLVHDGGDEARLSLQQIEQIIGRPLPPSAYIHERWWDNGDPVMTHTQCRSWQAAGYEATPDLKGKVIVFRRTKRG